jgi:hypothetical protein
MLSHLPGCVQFTRGAHPGNLYGLLIGILGLIVLFAGVTAKKPAFFVILLGVLLVIAG